MIKLRGLRWAKHVAHRNGKIHTTFRSKILKRSPVHLCIDRRIILKSITKKHDRRVWTDKSEIGHGSVADSC